MSQVNTGMSLRDPDIRRDNPPQIAGPETGARGPRARMRKALLDAAVELAGRGIIPSVSDVAEAAQVSRATAYRYFPSQSVLVQSMVADALGPILEWNSESDDPEERVGRLIHFGYRRMERYEASLRAALRLALDQWARTRAGTLGEEPRIVRGNRIRLLKLALAPLKPDLPKKQFDRLTKALAVVFGSEAMVVLKDMFHLEGDDVADIAEWMARALVRAAAAEAGAGRKTHPGALDAPHPAGGGTRRRASVKSGARPRLRP